MMIIKLYIYVETLLMKNIYDKTLIDHLCHYSNRASHFYLNIPYYKVKEMCYSFCLNITYVVVP